MGTAPAAAPARAVRGPGVSTSRARWGRAAQDERRVRGARARRAARDPGGERHEENSPDPVVRTGVSLDSTGGRRRRPDRPTDSRSTDDATVIPLRGQFAQPGAFVVAAEVVTSRG